MNRKLAIIGAIFGILLLIFGIFLYLGNNTPSPSVKPSISVKISTFNLTGYYNPVGVVWMDTFLLTFRNNGTTEVNNATITFSSNSTFEMTREIWVFEPFPTNNSINTVKMGEQYSLGTIKANETIEFNGGIWNYLGDSSKVHGFAFIATLKSNDTSLDQQAIMIPPLL